MKKRYRRYGATILLLTILVSLSGCTTIDKIEKKLGWKTEYFQYLSSDNVEQVSIQSTRDLGFKFIVTEEATKREIYNFLSKAQISETKNPLDPDYIIEFDLGDEVQKFYFVVDNDGGNFYNDSGIYTVSESLVDSVIQNLSFTRKPKYFESIYFDSIEEVLKTVKNSLENKDVSVGVNIQGDVECLKYVYSDDIQYFLKNARKIFNNVDMVQNNAGDFQVVLTVKNRGFNTTTYKTAITVANKEENTEHTYYIVAYYEYKKWNVTVSEADIKPNDW